MFNDMIEQNELELAFKYSELEEIDITFIKELIAGPLNRENKVCLFSLIFLPYLNFYL